MRGDEAVGEVGEAPLSTDSALVPGSPLGHRVRSDPPGCLTKHAV
jgi:hypothetical protein